MGVLVFLIGLLAQPLQAAELNGVPFVRQTPGACGPAALASVMAYYGTPVELEVIVRATYTPAFKGALVSDLENFARAWGFCTELKQGDQASINGRDRGNGFRDCVTKNYPNLKQLEVPTKAWSGEDAAAGVPRRGEELRGIQEGEAPPALGAEQQVGGERGLGVRFVEVDVGVGQLADLRLEEHHDRQPRRLLALLDHLQHAVVRDREADDAADGLAVAVQHLDLNISGPSASEYCASSYENDSIFHRLSVW